ncbi:MAG: SDR family NAD(P)-dependent oxidoreductase [Elainella sp. C42_A2020_010]|nr:SDR family NAD(P)-dependent oxidoreductase [Elainella sp. C42_A2020_010]
MTPTPDYRTLLLEAWQEMRQMRLELESLTEVNAPIAVIGMDCRFPGGANSPEAYWNLLQNGIDAITEVPPDRWDWTAYYDPDPDAPGRLYSRHGGFIDQVDQFDPQFFGISPREAVSLDPQQRLLLEVSYTALERAGQAIDRLRGSQTGVYIGISFADYAKLSLHSGDLSRIDAYSSLGNTHSMAVGRLAYVLGLQGPTMQLDTTCSSSLLAVHLACQSLRNGESNLALAGGVNLMLSPEPTIGFCKLRALSPSGQCRTFDANADGYIRGEGCGIVVLKRLKDAITDRDPILAIIRGSAANHDGQSNGLTAPNGQAQEAVIQQALGQAGVAAAQVQYVEAHGTGTPLGDPIEVLALSKVLAQGRSADNPLWIGSVKTNIGHLESAAGVASLIKTVLALQHQQIPPHLHFQQPNPYIPWQQLAVQVPTHLVPWPSLAHQPRLAGVSSFGMSGTNVHVILEEFVEEVIDEQIDKQVDRQVSTEATAVVNPSPSYLFTISAKTRPALKQLAERYEVFLTTQADELLPHICFTANTGRSQFEHRFAVRAESITQLRQALRQFIADEPVEPPADSLVQCYLQGEDIDWNQLSYSQFYRRVVLPTYPFQKQHYWMEPLPVRSGASRDNHPLLGRRLVLAKSATIHFEAQLDRHHPAFLQQHRVFEQPIMPAAGYIEMVLAAVGEVMPAAQLELAVSIHQRLVVDSLITVQLTLTPAKTDSQSYEFEIFALRNSDEQQKWECYASGTINQIDLSNNQTASMDLRNTVASNPDFTELDVERFYQTYRQHGIEYGAAFRAIRQLWQGHRTAMAWIELPSSCSSAAPYQIHPVLLDAALQTIAAALPAQSQTYLPVRFDRLILHRRPLGHPSSLWSEVTLRSNQNSVHPVADLRLLDAKGQVILTIAGLRLHPADQEPIESASWQEWLYQIEWRPQPLHQVHLPELRQVSHQFAALTDRLSAAQAQHLNSYQQHLTELESLSLSYIRRAFLQLGWRFTSGEHFTVQQVMQQLQITANPRWVRRLLNILVEADYLDCQNNQYGVLRSLQDDSSAEMTQPVASPELALLHRCGSALADVLQGKCDPIQLLFPDGDFSTLSQIYQDSPGAQFTNQLLQQLVRLLLPQSKVQILEIGGGTGGTTGYLLPDLDSQIASYTFTDISPLFVQTAQQKFAVYDFVQCQTLDIERSPRDQGFRQHQYDLVVAANVLHATQNLETTLSHVRQLLAPGGVLILLEGVYPMRWLDLTFGLTDGWWRFTDNELRPDYPLISVAQWRSLLQSCGFECTEAIQPTVNGSAIQQAIIVAQVGTQATLSLSDFDWLIVGDQQGVAAAMVSRLQAVGAAYRLVSADTLSESLETPFTRPTQVIFLAALDAPDPADLSVEALETTAATLCSRALHLLQSLPPTQPMQLWLVTQGAVATGNPAERLTGLAQSLLWGIGKTVQLEYPELNCVCIDLDPDLSLSYDADRQVEILFAELTANSLTHSEPRQLQVAFRQQQRYIARLIRCSSPDSLADSPGYWQQRVQLQISQHGSLDNLHLQTMERSVLGPHDVEIRVQATGLNFRDVLNALDLYPGEAGPLGCECVGEISAVGEQVASFQVGDRVMALASGSFSNWVTVDAAMLAPVPARLSSEAAATVPVAFLTASYALRHLAGLKRGERVLIHAAAGGVGQAAIQVARQVGAEIYATASPEKWPVLQELGVTQVFSSRNLEFATELMRLTQGKGIDVVLNSLTGEFISPSLSVLKPQGRWIELGKTDWTYERVQAQYPNLEYVQMDLVELCQQQPNLIQEMLRQIGEQIQQGIYQPLPYDVFPITEAVQAFRQMQQAKHVGKLVITQPQPITSPPIRPDSTYLITGGTAGLGLLMADWFVQQGAKHLVLLSRRIFPTITPTIQAWQQAGVRVVTAAVDVADRSQLAQCLTDLESSLPPLGGIIHAAGVLDDGMLHQQTWEKFAAVLRPKLLGAWNLHQLTQTQPLDFYVLFSSATALLGAPGQANHVAANIFLDSFAHYRRSLGLPALSINWGIWSEVGSAAARQAETRFRGMGSIAPSQGVAAFAALLSTSFTQVGVLPMRWREFGQGMSPGLTDLLTEIWTEICTEIAETSQQKLVNAQPSEILPQLHRASASEQRSLLQAYLGRQVAQVLGFQETEINPQKGFFDLGMDSLTSVELKNRLQTALNCTLPATVAFDYPTIEALTDYLIASLNLQLNNKKNEPTPEIQQSSTSAIDTLELDHLSEAELAKLLAQELIELSGGTVG